jgi:hypothetical protein
MGKRGDGYGSEYHLHRLLTDDRKALDEPIAAKIGIDPATIEWLDSRLAFRREGDCPAKETITVRLSGDGLWAYDNL